MEMSYEKLDVDHGKVSGSFDFNYNIYRLIPACFGVDDDTGLLVDKQIYMEFNFAYLETENL